MRKSRFIVLACVLLLAVILVAIPTTATAAIDSVKWSVPVYQGLDNYYGANVVAFTAGSTANVTVQVTNDQGVDVTIREAKILLDWGTEYTGTGPAVLRTGETGSFTFAVAVPATASSSVLHAYQVKVGYQRQDANYVTTYQAGQMIGNGDGATLQFFTVSSPILESSLRVFWRDTLPTPDTITYKDPSTYSVDALTGRITFGAAPPVGTQVYVDYQYFQSLGAGNGVKTVFFTVSKPVVNGTLQAYVANGATGTFTVATGWTADYETGKITLASAPTAFETVYVTYESWTRWPIVANNNLAVYGTVQAGAMTAFQEYTALNANAPAFWVPLSTAGATARSNAAVFAAQANARYAAGDFAAAGDLYEDAVDQLKASYAANASLSGTAETAVASLVQNAAPVVEAYGNKLDGEAKAAEGQASMYKNVGVFSILLGVATLLAGLAGILWAYSRLVEARGPKQMN